LQPRLHLAGGAPCERESQDVRRVGGTVEHTAGDAAREHSGLAAASRRDHCEWSGVEHDGLALALVETVHEAIRRGHRGEATGGLTATLRPVFDVAADRFEELVADALDAIPPELGRLMSNVAVFVEEERSPWLLGLYEGIPLTSRAGYGTPNGALPMPDRITIFRLPILRRCRSEEDVLHQVKVTVVHEVAHHFGIDDARLHELGWA
jgi:predicted Zn-dependent protease with MMP-like domain